MANAKPARPGEDGEHEAGDARRRLDGIERRARGLEDVTVGHAGRAGGFAAATAEAAVEVGADVGVVERERAFGEGAREQDAAARGVVFVA